VASCFVIQSNSLFRDSWSYPNGYSNNEAAIIVEDMKHWIPIVIVILALLGAADSVYMTLAHYKLISASAVESSGACPLTGRTCATVITSPRATIAGIPHAVLGVGYFALLAGAALWRIRIGHWFAPWEMLAFLAAGFAWSIFLTQELLIQLHIPCPYCLTAHFLNAVIVALYALSFR